MSISARGVEIGCVASGTYSPSLSIGIASGYITRNYSRAGQTLDLQVRRKQVSVVVVDPPFVSRTSLKQDGNPKGE